MKAAPLALACALLGATALAPPTFAQTSPGASPGAGPSTSPSDASRSGADRGWRDDDRGGGWRDNRDRDEERFARRDGRSYGDDDDDDGDDWRGPGPSGSRMGGMMGSGGMGYGMGGRGASRSDSDNVRWHMQMMRKHFDRGARLQLKRGDSSIDIRCPSGENITACVDAVGKLMDRLQNMPQTPATPR